MIAATANQKSLLLDFGLVIAQLVWSWSVLFSHCSSLQVWSKRPQICLQTFGWGVKQSDQNQLHTEIGCTSRGHLESSENPAPKLV